MLKRSQTRVSKIFLCFSSRLWHVAFAANGSRYGPYPSGLDVSITLFDQADVHGWDVVVPMVIENSLERCTAIHNSERK